MKVAVTGATGFIGAELVRELDRRGIAYTVITRARDRARSKVPSAVDVVEWGPSGELDPKALEGLDGIIHMAGAPVAQRWSDAVRSEILESREIPTRGLVDALGKTSAPRPGVLVSFSAIGYYGPTGDDELTESAPPGSDFLAGVCQVWEREAARAVGYGVRVVNPRVGIVIGKGGGALARMLVPFRLGAGGPIGNGRQWMSWVHVSDVAGIAIEALTNTAMNGPVNATAPLPVRNRDFSRALGRALRRPAILPIPVFGLKVLFGEFAEILATGQRVVPQAALDAGYRFRHMDLDEALRSAI
jgi:hypothetical protein